jgi:glycerophosphoryl diester phosphodiesterase
MSCKKSEIFINPITIAHRGIYSDRPENSKQSFQECIRKGITSVEFDVYLTKDDSVLLIHDLNVEELAGLSGQVNDYTTQELKEAVFAKSGAKSLTLEEFFNRYKNKFESIFIDLKEGQGNDILYQTAIHIADLSKTVNGICKTYVTCTSASPLDTINKISPSVNAVIEISDVKTYIQYEQRFSYILMGFTELETEESAILRASGTRIITFTPNTVTEYQIAIKNGCYAIMTDNPDLLKDYLSRTNINKN